MSLAVQRRDAVLGVLAEQTEQLDAARPADVPRLVVVLCAIAGLDARDTPRKDERRRGATWGAALFASLLLTCALVVALCAMVGLGRSGLGGWAVACGVGVAVALLLLAAQRAVLAQVESGPESADTSRVIEWVDTGGAEVPGEVRLWVQQALYPSVRPRSRPPVAALALGLTSLLCCVTIASTAVFVSPAKEVRSKASHRAEAIAKEQSRLNQRLAELRQERVDLRRKLTAERGELLALNKTATCAVDPAPCDAREVEIAALDVELANAQGPGGRDALLKLFKRVLAAGAERVAAAPQAVAAPRSFGERISGLPGQLARDPMALVLTLLLLVAGFSGLALAAAVVRVRPHEAVLRRATRRRIDDLRQRREFVLRLRHGSGAGQQ